MRYAEVNATSVHYPNIVSLAHSCNENVESATIYFWESEKSWWIDDSSMEGAYKIKYCPFCGKMLPDS